MEVHFVKTLNSFVDTIENTVTFFRPFNKKIISANYITEYFQTVYRNAFKVWYGLLIKLEDNKTIQVAGQNIESLSNLKDYLDERNIKYVGQRNMRFPFN